MKYELPRDQGEVRPNLLGLADQRAIELSELEGFLKAELVFFEELNDDTVFDADYILRIHRTALSHLYAFAGELREVNVSKGGFSFPAAKFLSDTMRAFNNDILSKLSARYDEAEALVRDIALVHGELLLIHPFREGNGRTARLLADMMAMKQGHQRLRFDQLGRDRFDEYVHAVQRAAVNDRAPMQELIRSIFPS
jgi:cell filamentation protein